ncbi:glycosyltransferase [Amycolatopsis anabasis]|uniref:glycosyltransferase n=1 Tax=Amycolatopsis anabasis TaxID=1840409 RepID=UPI00131BB14A|nr:glycosyltransferase [Amycolatopsis anabasis]
MPTISVITAVLDGVHQHLAAAYESLVQQDLPAGWDWQWVVQEDGRSGRPLAELPDDPRISTGMGEHGRPAAARTLALSRATGRLMLSLDADDLLPVGALARAITTLTRRPDLGWCVAPALDLFPDGRLRFGPRDPASGPLPPGRLAAGEASGLLPVVGGTLVTYTALVRALGGWPAFTRDEDVALLLAVEAVAPGWMLAEPGLLYRQWPGSTTASDPVDNRVPSAPSPARQVFLERVDALAQLGWRWPGNLVGRNLTRIDRISAGAMR